MDSSKSTHQLPIELPSSQRFPELSANGIDLLNSLLTYDPDKRLTAAEALRHPFFSENPLPKAPELMPNFPSCTSELGDCG